MADTVQRGMTDSRCVLLRNQRSSSSRAGLTGIFHQGCDPRRKEKPAAGSTFARFATGFILAFVVIAGVSAAPRPAAADEVPVAFIRALGDQALSVIRSDMPLPKESGLFPPDDSRGFRPDRHLPLRARPLLARREPG